jgi:metal-responsive CopG/Arc/MetJ family transcriptional regulator
MSKTAVKLALSLPPEDFREMENLRRKLKTTRSAVIRQALQTYFQARRQRAMVARYEKGYRKFPETSEELAGFAQAELEAMEAEERA